jgi:hypothetical protein
MPHEVSPGASVELTFPSRVKTDIALQGAAILVMKTERLKPFLRLSVAKSDWIARPAALDDFEDAPVSATNQWTYTGSQTVGAVTVIEEDVIEPSVVESLVEILYQNPAFSVFARSALIRVLRVKPDILGIWVATLKRLVEQGAVHSELWTFVWRDFSLLPPEHQRSLQDALWGSGTPIGSVASVLSAFSFDP